MYDIVIMDMNSEGFADCVAANTIPVHATSTRYNGSHLATIKRIIEHAKTEYVWVVCSECRYDDFDFGWKPAPWEALQLHCWASEEQQQGDTFLVPVKEFKKQNPERLEWFEDVHYHYPGVPRRYTDIRYTNDFVKTVHSIERIYEVLTMSHDKAKKTGVPVESVIRPKPSMWGPERAIYPLAMDGSMCWVPRDAKKDVKWQLYDYPHINDEMCDTYRTIYPDVAFIEYDEPDAEQNFLQLKNVMGCNTDGEIVRISGVKGMVNALKEAAYRSRTSWFFAVFAKTFVRNEFDFIRPYVDALAKPKHYVFYAYNPVLDYSYGNGGIVLYHSGMVETASEWGTDFTMSFPIQTVPIVSCDNNYNTDPWSAWRTAFREVGKLHKIAEEDHNVEAEYRRDLWLTRDWAKNGDWSARGAHDGMEHYAEHGDDMRIFDWEWLFEKFTKKYGTEPDRVPFNLRIKCKDKYRLNQTTVDPFL